MLVLVCREPLKVLLDDEFVDELPAVRIYIGTYHVAATITSSGTPQKRLIKNHLLGQRRESKKYNATIANGNTSPIKPFARGAKPIKK